MHAGTPDTVELTLMAPEAIVGETENATESLADVSVQQVDVAGNDMKSSLHLGDKLTELAARRERLLQDSAKLDQRADASLAAGNQTQSTGGLRRCDATLDSKGSMSKTSLHAALDAKGSMSKTSLHAASPSPTPNGRVQQNVFQNPMVDRQVPMPLPAERVGRPLTAMEIINHGNIQRVAKKVVSSKTAETQALAPVPVARKPNYTYYPKTRATQMEPNDQYYSNSQSQAQLDLELPLEDGVAGNSISKRATPSTSMSSAQLRSTSSRLAAGKSATPRNRPRFRTLSCEEEEVVMQEEAAAGVTTPVA